MSHKEWLVETIKESNKTIQKKIKEDHAKL